MSCHSSVSSHSRAADSATICCASTSRGFTGSVEPVELTAAHRIEKRRALHQVIARQREQPPLGRAADAVARAADALQEGGDRARRAQLAHEVDFTDVDAELERGGRHQRAQLAAFQALLGVQARFLGEAAVVRGDVLLAEPLGEVAREALGLAARVDEDQRGAVLAHQLRQAVVDLRPDFPGHHRLQRRGGNLELQVARAHVPGVDDGADGAAVGGEVARADEEARDVLDRLLRRRQPDARQAPPGEGLEPLERERQMRAALAGGHGVDLVDDHRARAREHRAPGGRAHEDVERLGRRHHDVRRRAAASPRARAAGCPRCARRCGCRARQARARRARRGCPRAAPRGSCGCRSRAPSAGRRRRRRSHPRARRPPAPRAPAHRSRRGRPRASCPSRWARRSARAAVRGSAATRPPGLRSACRRRARTSAGRRGERRRACAELKHTRAGARSLAVRIYAPYSAAARGPLYADRVPVPCHRARAGARRGPRPLSGGWTRE